MIKAEKILLDYKKLRKGESVKCELCNKGELKPIGADYEHTNCFECSCCKEKVIID